MKKKNLAFTLAEVLIVIGIIGVVAALTLPNLNHATGDKETVTRLQKAYSILNEANDRAVAIYGPISTWVSNEQCLNHFDKCYLDRIGEFLKISKSCDDRDEDDESYVNCEYFEKGDMSGDVFYQLADGSTVTNQANSICDFGDGPCKCQYPPYDICSDSIYVDINGPTKGKNREGNDIFQFLLSDSLGLLPDRQGITQEDFFQNCLRFKDCYSCTFWPIEYGNLDYLKADSSGKCNDSNIILDGTTNTSCH